MTEWKARRFWRAATVEPVEGGVQLCLDGRPVRTPGKLPLVLPTRALAEAMAEEWNAQEDVIAPATMPVTRAANSAVERVMPHHGDVVAMLAAYAETDLLCYRAEAPETLIRRQADGWDPMLDWADEALGAGFRVTRGVLPVDQEAATLDRIRAILSGYAPFPLTAVHDLVTLSGSVVLGLAVAEGRLSPETAFDLSRIDEVFQAEIWGEDAEAAAAAADKRAQYLQAHRFLRLCCEG
ncbi:MAG: ATPase [Rhodobacteraceae bacterium]|jgi:chaperone required for assembly of F1-ATPase|nr:ATPase [Paracoccaceae bacterium]